LEFLIDNKCPTFNFLFIGRLITHKGIEEFYKASIKLISNSNVKLKFIVVGQYDKFDQYSIDQTLYNKIHKNENFELIGYTSNVTKYILRSNCILLSSKREGMPMALLEAGAIGRPIIASDVPGCNEIVIDNFNGFKYKSGDIKDLFNKMKKMITLSQKQILNFSYNSHKHISENFSSNTINDKYYKIIQENL
jgi:galacturonosyltransferase